MKRLFLLFFSAAVICSCSKIELEGERTEFTFSTNEITSLSVEHGIEAIVTDDVSEVTVNTDVALADRITIRNVGGSLVFGYKMGTRFKDDPHTTVQIPSDLANLKGLELSGASSISVEKKIVGNELKILASGASRIDLSVDVNKLEMVLSGASETSLNGYASKVKTLLSGASQLKSSVNGDLYTFETDQFTGDLSGASIARINCNEKISANLSGGSFIYFTGKADHSSCLTSGGSMVITGLE
jgi:hypothetical protein